jgi:hypothetical protein
MFSSKYIGEAFRERGLMVSNKQPVVSTIKLYLSKHLEHLLNKVQNLCITFKKKIVTLKCLPAAMQMAENTTTADLE